MARGASVHFACAGLPAGLDDWLRRHDFSVSALPAAGVTDWRGDLVAAVEVARGLGRVDLLVVDHYCLEQRWERGMRAQAHRILVIDDLANRDHDCDFLLDQNLHDDAESRYARRVPIGTRQFLGPRYALLRPEFDEPGLERVRDGSVANLLVFFGGTDPGNQALKVLDALRALGPIAPNAVIVLGPAHPHRDLVRGSAAGLPRVRVLDATEKMSQLIAHADLAIGTCGVAAWERCALGLPSLVVVTAENQREDAEILCRLGAVRYLGDADGVDADGWAGALRQAMEDPHCIRSMGRAARDVMAGRRAALAALEEALVNAIV